jgi:hypothetical protein
VVQSVEIQILEADPIQVNAIVRGQLPDAGCTTISSVDQLREGNSIKVMLTTTTDPLALCAQALTPFEQMVSVDVSNLPPARYTLDVNGVEQSFKLLTRDAVRFQQVLVEALNTRNYDLLRVLMDENVLMAYWRSEGNTGTPEQAVEQLQMNLLNSSSPIVAHPAENLYELMGTEPAVIVGLPVAESTALLTSGWGPEGKDEAILFIARLPDGTLYWHGFLYALGGFAEPEAGSVVPTNVQYVMAQRDIQVYAGPSTETTLRGQIFGGQIARVTGSSADGGWFQIECPDDPASSCWVSTNPADTLPTQMP